ncbi:MAG: DUF1365 family protein [Nocardioides sp.]
MTYDLTRLMRCRRTGTTCHAERRGRVDPATVLDRWSTRTRSPLPRSPRRARLPEIDTDRVVFAGAYHGWGFHEDGARSGLAAAERLGATWSPRGVPPVAPAQYAATITHTRRTPFRRTFTHHQQMWLVDLDDLPDHGVLGRFEARDHLGDPARTLRENVDAFAARHGIDLTGGRVLMAAHARAFGYCFNPISVHWCFDRDGRQAAVVVEVHNTYGDRHAYLVHPDEQGRARTDKRLYVSPFHGVDGRYELAVPVPGDRLTVAVTLHTEDGEVQREPGRPAPAAARPAERARRRDRRPCSSAPTASGSGRAGSRSGPGPPPDRSKWVTCPSASSPGLTSRRCDRPPPGRACTSRGAR